MLTHLVVSETLLLNVAKTSPRYESYTRQRLRLLKAAAISDYLRQARNSGRTSETSPPRYTRSWRIVGARGHWVLVNTDPGALWVEFGAHAGGKTEVLKYRPLGHAIDIVASGGLDG